MKKIIMMGVALVTFMMGMVSCDKTKQSFVYDIAVEGKADGMVDIMFPNGTFYVDGDTNLKFTYSNNMKDGLKTMDMMNVLTEKGIMECGDEEKVGALNRVNTMIDNEFKIMDTSTDAHYDLRLKGYVKESITGFVIYIDRHWTNIEP